MKLNSISTEEAKPSARKPDNVFQRLQQIATSDDSEPARVRQMMVVMKEFLQEKNRIN
jgi:hypothetical protein